MKRQVAVALRYEAAKWPAPKVTAKGYGELAARIEAAARAGGVPVREDADLAGLLARLDVGDWIPPRLYAAVAEVLAFVYRLNADAGSQGKR